MRPDPEPRHVPVFTDPVKVAWYCLHCGTVGGGEHTILTHVKISHSIESPQNGEDYAIGAQVVLMQGRRREWLDKTIRRFSLELDSLRGVDDFTLEVGDGVKDVEL